MGVRSDSTRAAFGRVMRDTSLRRLLGAYSVYAAAETGGWVAVLVWAHRVGGARSVGLLGGSILVIAAIITPIGTAFADRLPRHRALMLAYWVVGVAFSLAGVVLALDAGTLLAYVMLLVATVSLTLVRPLHSAALPGYTRSPIDVVAANVVTVNLDGVAVFVGPLLAGVVLEVGGVWVVFVAGGVALILAGITCAGVGESRLRFPAVDDVPGALAGLLVLVRNRDQRTMLTLGGGEMIAVGALDALVVLLALDVLDIGEGGAGYLTALLGAGALAGGIVAVAVVARSRVLPVVVLGALVRAGGMLGILFAPDSLMLALLLVAGVGFSLIDVSARTLLQRSSAAEVLGRAFGLFEGLQVAGYAVGTVAAPLVAAAIGVPGSFGVFAVVVPIVVLARYRALQRVEEHAADASRELQVLRTSPLLAGLEPRVLERLAHRASWAEVDRDNELIAEGASSQTVYLIESGSFDVSRQGRHVRSLGAGELVGEIAPLKGVSRTATVTARSSSRVLVFAGPGFVEAITGYEPTWSQANELAERRIDELGEEV